jgi:hypothetical protein
VCVCAHRAGKKKKTPTKLRRKKLPQNQEEKNSDNIKKKKTPTKWLLTRISLLKSPQKWGSGA